jgi:hypothetical protein
LLNRLFLAGDYLCTDLIGCAHGAYKSGLHAAKRCLKSGLTAQNEQKQPGFELNELSFSPDLKDHHIIFVYGTLMSGLSNHKYLEEGDNHFVSKGKTVQNFTMYAVGVPFVDPDACLSPIIGEVWQVTD